MTGFLKSLWGTNSDDRNKGKQRVFVLQHYDDTEASELNDYLANSKVTRVSCEFAGSRDHNSTCLISFNEKKDADTFVGHNHKTLKPVVCEEVLWNVHVYIQRPFVKCLEQLEEQKLHGLIQKSGVTYNPRTDTNGVIEISGLLSSIHKFASGIMKLSGPRAEMSDIFENCSALLVPWVATALSDSIPIIRTGLRFGQIRFVCDTLDKLSIIEKAVLKFMKDHPKETSSTYKKCLKEIMNLSHNIGDINVSLCCDNIIKQRVDVLVNSSNSQLRHDGGLAFALLQAGGPTIQQESNDFIERNGDLLPGNVCYTSAGKLTCDHIIHVVGHDWDPADTGKSIRLLHDSLMNTLNCASSIGARSLAIPVIGTGVYGFPVKVCARVYRTTLEEFSKTTGGSTSLKDVRIVNNSVETLKEFIDEFRNETSNVLEQEICSSGEKSQRLEETAVNWRVNDDSNEFTNMEHSDVDNGWVDLAKEGHVPSSTTMVTSQKYEDTFEPDDRDKTYGDGESYLNNMPKVNSESSVQEEEHGSTLTTDPLPVECTSQTASTADATAVSNSNASSTPDIVSPAPTTATIASQSGRGDCPICVDDDVPLMVMTCCKNTICNNCFDRHFDTDAKCPFCTLVVLMKKGNQPHGTMDYSIDEFSSLPGYEGMGTIIITYQFPSGIQQGNHPKPGVYYTGTSRRAYLPANEEGREVLELLKRGFDQQVLFTIGKSVTTGQDDCVLWNDVHHKTNTHGGPAQYGYPDPTYLSRVKEELAAKGIK
ncbi:uncharacterized protein LOC144437515 [Glandiceps talaboti]